MQTVTLRVFTCPLRWNRASSLNWMSVISQFIQHAPHEATISQNSVLLHDMHGRCWVVPVFLHGLKCNGLLHTFCASDAVKPACCGSDPMIFSKKSSIQHRVLIKFSELARVFSVFYYCLEWSFLPEIFQVIVNCCPVSKRHIRKFSSEFMTAFLVWISFIKYVLYKNARCSNLMRIATVGDS